MRDKGTGPGTDAERKLFTTEHVEWKKTATKAAESGIGIDFFIAAGGGTYMDIATIGKLISHSQHSFKLDLFTKDYHFN